MELKFSAIPENEAFARMVVSAFLVQANPTLSIVSEVRTAVSEAVTNAIVHAYEETSGYVMHGLTKTISALKLRIRERALRTSSRRCSLFIRHILSRSARVWALL